MAITPTMPKSTRADALRVRIDAALDAYTDLPSDCPERLREAIRYMLLAPGKRLRPLIALYAAEACGGDPEAALPAACAVEMIHTYSLIHDDLPAMDDDDLRRGRPSCHKAFDEATAILAGDALIALAFDVLARDVMPPEVAVRCCGALARAAGAAALVGGQSDDLAAEQDDPPADAEEAVRHLEAIHRRKTGAMFRVAAELGGLCSGADAARLAALDAYARPLGLAFQVTDDLLDVEGDPRSVGKRVGKDHSRGKWTYPALVGAEESRLRAARLVDEAVAALAPFGQAAEPLAGIARRVLERRN